MEEDPRLKARKILKSKMLRRKPRAKSPEDMQEQKLSKEKSRLKA